MSFNTNAQNVRVEGTVLKATLQRADGSTNDSELDLNNCLGNNNGRFEWGSSGFSGSADNIRFEMSGGAQVPVIFCQLRNASGEMVGADCNLAERIGNRDGNLEFA